MKHTLIPRVQNGQANTVIQQRVCGNLGINALAERVGQAIAKMTLEASGVEGTWCHEINDYSIQIFSLVIAWIQNLICQS